MSGVAVPIAPADVAGAVDAPASSYIFQGYGKYLMGKAIAVRIGNHGRLVVADGHEGVVVPIGRFDYVGQPLMQGGAGVSGWFCYADCHVALPDQAFVV